MLYPRPRITSPRRSPIRWLRPALGGLLGLGLSLTSGCVTPGAFSGPGTLATDVPATRPRTLEPPPPPPVVVDDVSPRLPPAYPEVARRATSLLDRRQVVIEGRRFRADCSGLVKGLYAASDVNLYALGAIGKQRNGVAIIFRYVKRYGQLHRGLPRPGQLAFFDDTYDANGDGRRNDPLSHIGVVEKVRRDGTVVVIHYGSGSVRRLLVNTRYPSSRRNARGEPINDLLRREKDGPRLAGELLVAWGRLPPPGTRRLLAAR